MTSATTFLDLDDVLELARRLLGEPLPIRDVGLLGSAVARPQTMVGGTYAYSTTIEKAAALLQSIVNNHALIDGNKRLGWLATAVFLEINKVKVTHISNDEVFELVMHVASSNPTIEEISARMKMLLSESD